jgi:hypothetical protein
LTVASTSLVDNKIKLSKPSEQSLRINPNSMLLPLSQTSLTLFFFCPKQKRTTDRIAPDFYLISNARGTKSTVQIPAVPFNAGMMRACHEAPGMRQTRQRARRGCPTKSLHLRESGIQQQATEREGCFAYDGRASGIHSLSHISRMSNVYFVSAEIDMCTHTVTCF